jgi:glycosyltransferase involved in cell wall biosynthesis
MASGVIVVTWNVACLPEWYGTYAVLVDPPPYDHGSSHAPFGHNTNMNADDSVNALLNAIKHLDDNPEKKKNIRERAMNWATSQTWERSAMALDGILRMQS